VGLGLFSVDSDSTLAARISRPYLYFYDALSSAPFFGQGSGSAANTLSTFSNFLINTPSIVKVSLDYGLVGLLIFGILLFVIAKHSTLSTGERLALLIFMFIPTDGMYVAPISYFFILFFMISKNHSSERAKLPLNKSKRV
jgi:hypothetical protein